MNSIRRTSSTACGSTGISTPRKSNYQQIDIYDTPEFGKVLTLDGNVMLTERDEFIYDEMITHVPMAVHPNVQDVLVIGAGDGGVVKELARYESIRSIDLVEMDEPGSGGLPALSARKMPAAWTTSGYISTLTTPCASSGGGTPSMI